MRRTTALVVGLLGAIAFPACAGRSAGVDNSEAATPTAAATPVAAEGGKDAAAGEVVLRLDQPVTLEDGALVLTWTDVQDSRCPRGVQCFWAGEVTVRIAVAERGGDAFSVELTLSGRKPGAEVGAAGAHELRLVGVEPYPEHGVEVKREETRARVVVAGKGG